jgi:pyruvate-formate lyase
VGVSDLAELLPGIAAVITSVGGIVVSLYAIRRGSKRERERAAGNAIDKVISGGDDDGDDDDRRDAIAAVVEEILKRQEKDGEP